MKSPLEIERLKYKPHLPAILRNTASISFEQISLKKESNKEIEKLFPNTYDSPLLKIENKPSHLDNREKKVGVVFSGGQAAGGHNVIAGIYDALMELNAKSELVGFLNGPAGIVDGKYEVLSKEKIDRVRNVGGFDLIGSGRTKIETDEQLQSAMKVCKELHLDGLVIIGGDDSNTNAAILAEYFQKNDCKTVVVGVPKTIDGDLRYKDLLEITFGFDTACRVYSEMIGNIQKDALSAKKYYHFIRLMGRSASHIAMECALQTQPNYVLIAEEIEKEKKTIKKVAEDIADVVIKRAQNGKNYGVVLIPEGLIEFIPEIKLLISELNKIVHDLEDNTVNTLKKHLSNEAFECFESLPKEIQKQLLLDRDPHGNVKVSQIETEKLLLKMVEKVLDNKIKFNALCHFFGYEGRSGFPSNFDADYCYSLGFLAALLVNGHYTGYMSCINQVKKDVDSWQCYGLPITMLMNMEERKGKKKPVIKKALIDLKSKIFLDFAEKRKSWQMNDMYICPGPIQYYGDEQLVYKRPLSL